ncbi:hypothetical protein QVD17_17393 [Tagetes erecta]|uniref:Uncharacterized protein n=1 Tax=Tagetes erecta TaxID=13708 RepID=A0AAD8KSZ3_TARER|nr:hypothetical protein QVD17_17393 [Tagetes erecta]
MVKRSEPLRGSINGKDIKVNFRSIYLETIFTMEKGDLELAEVDLIQSLVSCAENEDDHENRFSASNYMTSEITFTVEKDDLEHGEDLYDTCLGGRAIILYMWPINMHPGLLIWVSAYNMYILSIYEIYV